jgi:ATP-dependent exoDNAse (exonuclease V) alpha subunit
MQKGSGMLDDESLQRIHLTEQMRQQGVIHQVAEANREEVYFPTESMQDDDSAVHVHATNAELIQRMVSDIIADPRGIEAHPNYCLITYTNDAVYEIGQMVRDIVIANELGTEAIQSPFAPGEYVMSYSNNAAAYNGEVAKVVDVTHDPLHRNTESRNWDSYRVCIEGSRGICWVNAVAPKEYVKIQQKIDDLIKLVREAQKHKAFDAVNAYMEEIEHLRNYWTKFLYPFAITCHKSQGSTIENVYVDTLSFSKASNKRALLYVGLSRASKTLHTVIVPKPRWQVVREINDRYRNAKHAYEIAFNEPAWKVRVRTGLPAQTAEQKLVIAEYIEMMLLDAAQDDENQENTPQEVISDAIPSGYILSGEGNPVEF